MKYSLAGCYMLDMSENFVFMSCTARRDISHMTILVPPLTKLLVSSISDWWIDGAWGGGGGEGRGECGDTVN